MVGTEKIHTKTPVAVWNGTELKLYIGDVDVTAVAFETCQPFEDRTVDFARLGVDVIVSTLGEDRIDRIVVYERQPLTIVKREARLVSEVTDVEGEEPQGGPPMIEPEMYSHTGRYGFVAYLK